MPDQPNNGSRSDHDPNGVSPIMPGRPGRPSFSLDALRERVERQFSEETADRTDILLELDTADKRRDLLDEIIDYVLAVEAVMLTPGDRQRLIDRAYANLFTFGPLETLLRDDSVTEITVNGPYDIHARHGLGALEPVEAAFDDIPHLATILQRVLAGAGVTLAGAFLETGVMLYDRPARLSVIGPPVRSDYSIEIRLHPAQPRTLPDLVAAETLDARAADLLDAIMRAGHGALVVGDTGVGKTTLAGALLHTAASHAGDHTRIAVVERAAELHLPHTDTLTNTLTVTRHTPANASDPLLDAFAAAQDDNPAWLFADEVRSDDAAALWDALTRPDAPRYVWVFRGARRALRLKSALEMVIRQHVPAIPQPEINRALVARLPFVVALRRTGDRAWLASIAEWTPDPDDPAALDLRPLLEDREGGWALTGHTPQHDLPVPRGFWDR